MQERIHRAQAIFHFSLFVMLGTAMASAVGGGASGFLIALTLGGAASALLAKIRLSQLQRTIRRQGPQVGLWATH